ncbi:STAS-like domain-containing protein [Vulcanococcus sp. Clear-D1]|uniref:STAS-like domain-containing protein n=1 Tax=Vulcanococcus sp. Clear-D1 TaxID=2766970 RepID=UPI001999A2D3|nr:STAS-like domain-containing protein [Vulcanococcus sp. Clear-D1]MBD1194503.1 STAS-like domain-containing protein [Vulcanococcus sp. Clear-D1]
MARSTGTTIKLRGEAKTLAALQLIGLNQLLDIPGSNANVQPAKAPTVGVLPLTPIATEDQQFQAVDAICAIALAAVDNASAFIPALEWLANEILGNILTHAASETPGVVCAQYRPKQQRFDIGICDMGRGLLGSLQPAFPDVRSYGQAIDKAIERGVTRDPAIGQGNGMAGSYEIVRLNGGTYQIWTGDVVYELNKSKRRPGFQSMPAVFGTGVMFSLDTSKPVDLANTWIASATGAECLFLNTQTDAASDTGLNVAAECLHTGGRAPAKLLRRKIQSLLPAMDGEPLILDFSCVKSAASSFLDELLGRLADEDPRGQAVFDGPVRIQGMNPTVQAMANVVVAQRLRGSIDRSPDAED